MKLKSIVDEVFQDYKFPSMMLTSCKCDFKCLTEKGLDINICHNSPLAKQKDIEVSEDSIINRYLNNKITKAIIIAGFEPFLQFDEVINFIHKFRQVSTDDVVIYTGYYEYEIDQQLTELRKYVNIVVKFMTKF